MKKLLLLALLRALNAHSAHAADPASLLDDAIYNGRPVAADGQAWKSAVALSFETSNGYAACTGVFVAPDLILTAAHCRVKNGGELVIKLFKENSPDYVTITPAPEQFHYEASSRYRKASAYDPGTDDVAVLVLKNQPLPEGFEPASFQTNAQARASDPGRPATVIGAGMTEKREMSDRLYFTQGTIANYQAGGVMEVRFPGRTGVCGGDSGGPVFVRSGADLYLSALTTATPRNLGKDCGNVLYANVIDAKRYEWIQRTAEKLRGLLP